MLNVGTIGTSWITEQFIQALKLTRRYHIKGIYSRNAKNARDIAKFYQADYYCDQLNNLLYDPAIDVIYVASPNSLHFRYAKEAIRAGKHVIVEKPAFASVSEWYQIHQYAEQQGVKVFEAALHYHNRNYRRLRQLVRNLQKGHSQPFLGANFNIGQYSSRYEQYIQAMAGQEELPNIFNPEFAGGTLMDIGVYPLYVALDLFGMPDSVSYHTVKGPNQIDLFGNAILKYKNSQVNIFMSKGVHSIMPSEIYFDDETVVIEGITRIASVKLINKAGQEAKVIDYRPENVMYDELIAFAEVLTDPDNIQQQVRYEDWKQMSLQVAQVMEQLRKSANLKFN
ncbi:MULTISPECIES: Gfo/Idh/MocA family oxidoreductase [Globicatella]|uniref:Gfo/Idh/MocA family protein n=1 Tax=Globicatella TaxID=13075 RepID=UPI0028915155|nr:MULTISPECIES: Gfo/Idh/MocA family oxidoreductase [Globicatella]MDT2768662.1 Gfo/Idh/MocA family oxidoreductase [Globicatella sulfidifaciens]WPC08234.1 Gfo/Idh/MocA family oxidoreductase [Globicatella sp. PHS-GS-PNBC-21-1553]